MVDMPEDDCRGCIFCWEVKDTGKLRCAARILQDVTDGRPGWCPIKPVPERKCVKLNSRKRASSYVAWVKERLMNPEGETPMNLAYRLGYNRCIKDILEDNGDDKKETPDKE